MNSCASRALDAGPRRQAEVAHPVGEAEVHHLRHRPIVRRDVRRLLVQHPRRRGAVDVLAGGEGLLEVLVARDVGEDPQLDLGVVGGEQGQVRRAGDERAPDAPAELGPDRDVLEVRVDRATAARSTPPPGGTSCGAGRRAARAASAAPRRRSSAASCTRASRAACRSSGAPAAAPRARSRRSSSRSSCAGPSAGRARRTAPARAAWASPRLNSWPTSRPDLALEAVDHLAELALQQRRAPPRRARRPSPPSARAPGSAAARSRGRAARGPPASSCSVIDGADGERAERLEPGACRRRAARPRAAAGSGRAARRRRRRWSGCAARH